MILVPQYRIYLQVSPQLAELRLTHVVDALSHRLLPSVELNYSNIWQNLVHLHHALVGAAYRCASRCTNLASDDELYRDSQDQEAHTAHGGDRPDNVREHKSVAVI
jgi:hypothetical protein